MEDIKDQDTEDIKNDETSDEQSTEATEEPITPERAYELAKGLQKGYTMTRQDISEMRENLEAVQQALNELKQEKTEEFEEFDKKPLTKKDVLEAIAEYEQQKTAQQTSKQALVDAMIEDMKIEGLIKNDKEADDLIAFAIESAKAAGLKEIPQNYILSVYPAWQKAKEAEVLKEQVKTKVRGEAGSKVGTSEKARTGEQGVSYKEIRSKDWDEF